MRRASFAILWLAALPGLAAPAAGGPGSAPSRPAETVTLQLKWRHQFQFAGYYVARERGYYREAGLEVRIVEPKPDEDSHAAVLGGKAEFGVGASELVLLRAAGEPVVVLAVIFQHSPLVLLARRAAGLQTLHDLRGRRVMVLPQEAELFAYLLREKLPPEALHIVPPTFDVRDLISGRVDAMSGYCTDEPFVLQRAGVDTMVFTPRSAGIDFYGDCLFTTEEQVRRHPDRVEAFRQASLRGWEYALRHREETVDLILARYSDRHSREHLLFEAEESLRLINPNVCEVGYMYAGRWRHIADTYADLGMLTQEFSPEGFLYSLAPAPAAPGAWPWVSAVVLVVSLVIGAVAVRFQQLNRHLRDEIRERVAAEAGRRASEERYRLVYDAAPLAFVLWDRQRRITDWNRQAERIFGWSRAEALGRDIVELLVPAGERDRQAAQAADLLAAGPPTAAVNRNLTRGGAEIVCEWVSAAQTDEAGHVRGATSLAFDITERTRTEQALKESESRYRLLLDTAPFPVVISRWTDGIVLYANRRAAAQFGMDAAAAVGQPTPEFYADPTDRARLLEALRREGALSDFEVCFNLSTGDPLWVFLSATLTTYEGQPAVFAAFNDITARRLTEERLRRTLDELETFNRTMVGREKRMVELKDEVNRLLAAAGQPPRYTLPGPPPLPPPEGPV